MERVINLTFLIVLQGIYFNYCLFSVRKSKPTSKPESDQKVSTKVRKFLAKYLNVKYKFILTINSMFEDSFRFLV